jgi:dipeptidyl aminopeptidase/acylaminoacyl peptidase
MMTDPNVQTASYGRWKSPITAEKIAAGTTSIINLLVDGDDTYWCEMRPANKGRYTIVKRDGEGKEQDMTPPDFNVRTFVHEYGGGAFTVAKGVIYASNAADSKIYRIAAEGQPIPITEGQVKVELNGEKHSQGTRFADLRVTDQGLVAIGEQHAPGKPVENFLALIDIDSGAVQRLASGYDFYSSPAISPDGKRIAWICWNHPEMPWTHTELWVAEFNERKIAHALRVTGELAESILQPEWSPEGALYFISDRKGGWWNIHCLVNGTIEKLVAMEAEVGEPAWVFDRSAYAFMGGKILFAYNSAGISRLGLYDLTSRVWSTLECEGNNFHQLRSGKGCVRLLRGHPTETEALIEVEDAPGYPIRVLHQKERLASQGYISSPQHISYTSNGRTAYGFYYPPKNCDYAAPSGEKPPLVVMIHGGPTAQSKGALQWAKQFWTSQGFALLDVNYGGSTGYGRRYRELLNRNWGIVDVEDCVNGALSLVERGLADGDKLAIRGGSAGGYTTLAALAFQKAFGAGASYYGVADITALAHDTHKFETRYMEQLVGKYPEEREVWEQRSPIHAVDRISSPLILFQGEDDRIVPKNQSIMIYEALKRRGIPTEIHIYPGEEHGFRQAEHIIHSMNREADFYREVFKL